MEGRILFLVNENRSVHIYLLISIFKNTDFAKMFVTIIFGQTCQTHRTGRNLFLLLLFMLSSSTHKTENQMIILEFVIVNFDARQLSCLLFCIDSKKVKWSEKIELQYSPSLLPSVFVKIISRIEWFNRVSTW